MVGLFIGGRLLGLVQLSVLATAGAALLAGAALWVHTHPPELVARRELKERLQVGVGGRVDLHVGGASPGGQARVAHHTPTLALTDAFDRGRRAARFLLAPLAPGETARAAYRFPTERRGRFELGPLRAVVSDPFGVVQRSRRVLGTEEVIVYPRVHEILVLPESGGDELDRDQPRANARIDASGEFHTLREYAPGDDLRHVHWRSTARRGRLMMRQNEARRRAPVLVMLDVRPRAFDRDAFERAVEACGSIVTMLDHAARPVEVLLSTGEHIGAPGRRNLATVMDELAVVQPHGPDRLVLPATQRRTGALVAIMGAMDPADATAVSVLVRNGGMLTVVATTIDGDGVPVHARRSRPLLVPCGPNRLFTSSWNEAVLRWQRSVNLPVQVSRAQG
jgi:uncharacterized protein (DUF58 family)